jgi:hypothetical protein
MLPSTRPLRICWKKISIEDSAWNAASLPGYGASAVRVGVLQSFNGSQLFFNAIAAVVKMHFHVRVSPWRAYASAMPKRRAC